MIGPRTDTRFLPVLREAARGALQWRVLLLWTLVTLLPVLVAAIPVWQALSGQLDHAPQSPQWARGLDLVLLPDLAGQLMRSAGREWMGGVEMAAVAVALLLYPYLNGMLVSAARSVAPLKLGELLHGGLREYGPMLRLLFVSLLPLGIAAMLGGIAMKVATNFGEKAVLEADADHARWAALALMALLMAVAHATVTGGRAWLALVPRRRSALRAWWRGVRLVWARPLVALGLHVALTLAALLVLVALGWWRMHQATDSGLGFLLGVLLVQAVAATTGWMQFARLRAAAVLLRERSLGIHP